MANCINHRDRKATYLRNGLVYCDLCEVWWMADDHVQAVYKWDSPLLDSPQSERDAYSEKINSVIDIRDQSAKALLEG